jgi:hypothetical protein
MEINPKNPNFLVRIDFTSLNDFVCVSARLDESLRRIYRNVRLCKAGLHNMQDKIRSLEHLGVEIIKNLPKKAKSPQIVRPHS